MRSPIQDANEGAAMQVAPTKKHAVRTATVARENNNAALQKQSQINSISSKLGTALGNFMEGKRQTDNEQRYMAAYHAQGTKQGLTEYQRDMKNTGFTELIYGGQTPEYKGALAASARNASNAMYLEEAEFIQSEEGRDLTPDAYRKRIKKKLTDYNAENFADAPDAAFAFMANWRENSNELTKQQFKIHQVRLHEKARLTVAEGWQTDLDVYKKTIGVNPDRAVEIAKDMMSLKYKPSGMSEGAYWEVIKSEALSAARAHDFSAIKLINDSGIKALFNETDWKKYDKAVAVVDTDNFDTLEASRLAYETVIEDPNAGPDEVSNAKQQHESTILQVAARNTGSARHMKTAFGADRHRGVLGNQYRKMLADNAQEELDKRVENVEYNATIFDTQLLQADPADRRKVLAERIDDLTIAMHDPLLDKDVRANLAKQLTAGIKKLEGWESEADAREKKDQDKLDKARLEELEMRVGVQSLVTGGGYTVSDNKSKKAHLSGAVESAANQVIPEQGVSKIDKLEAIFSDPMLTHRFMKASGKFGSYLTDSDDVTTAISNLGSQLQAPNDTNLYTEVQKQQAAVLSVLSSQNRTLYNAAFPNQTQRLAMKATIDAIGLGKGIRETNINIEKAANKDISPANRLNGEKLVGALNLSGAPSEVQDMALAEYKFLLPLGHDSALQGAREYMSNINVEVKGRTIMYGGTFGKVADTGLEDVVKTLGTSYVDGDVSKSGFTDVLQRVAKNSRTKSGTTLFNLDQVSDLKVSVLDGNLVFESMGRVAYLSRDAIERELNGYKQRASARRTQRRR